jgi:hypothetical protein
VNLAYQIVCDTNDDDMLEEFSDADHDGPPPGFTDSHASVF